jgi:predicted O-linked N-acetylglucosamine transferase (SPINDLY family)
MTQISHSQAIALAADYFRAERYAEVETICRAVLQAQPEAHAACCLLGLVAYRRGDCQAAVALVQRAIELAPQEAEYYDNLGVIFNSQSRWSEAEVCYRRLLARHPQVAAAHSNLGAALQGQGRLAEAEACYRQAIGLEPGSANAHGSLGMALRLQGRLAEAEAACRQSLALAASAAAWQELGSVLILQGRHAEAEEALRQALAIDPAQTDACNNLGSALQLQGRFAEAEAAYRQALALQPGNNRAWGNLAVALLRLRRPEEAEAAARRALDLEKSAIAFGNLCLALQAQSRLEEAEEIARQSIQAAPDDAESHANLGMILYCRTKFDESEAVLRQALAIDPAQTDALQNLGLTLFALGRLEESIAVQQRAISLRPDRAETYTNLAVTLHKAGRLEEARQLHRQALGLKPSLAIAHSNLLLCEQYLETATPQGLAAVHAEWQQQHAAPLRSAWRRHDNDRDPRRPLRLGFVSPDFVHHPVAHFLVGVLEHFDRAAGEIVCYHDSATEDEMTGRFRAAASVWRDARRLSDEQLAQQVRDDAIDVLFDLAGHTAGNRLPAFARKPAPIQIAWIGYEGTTGLEAMDYLLADRYQVPPESEPYYCEKVLRLPEGYVCYDPPPAAPEPGPLPARRRGSVTLGSFNNPAKIGPKVVGVWGEILRRLPQARLVLKYRGMDDDATRRRLQELFAAEGIAFSRLELLSWSEYAESFSAYLPIDLALDPFPFAGSMTTCDALWMGVPVITCPGETFASRHGLGHLTRVGLEELIAVDLADYVQRVVALACDLPRLERLRGGLRDRVAGSGLCDGPRIARHLAEALRGVWQAWAGA